MTGASRGIGRRTARRLAEEGYALTISARREPGPLDAAAELRALGAEVNPVVTDLVEETDVQRLATAHTEHFAHLDLLLLGGGVGTEGPVAQTSVKTYDLVFTVNLRAQFLLSSRHSRLCAQRRLPHRDEAPRSSRSPRSPAWPVRITWPRTEPARPH